MIVYKTTNLINGKIYIGQTIRDDNKYYIGSGKYFKRAVDKYGKENFEREILEVLPDDATQNNLNECEIKWIKFYNSTDNKIGYNLAEGGNSSSGYSHTEETKQKISTGNKGKNLGRECSVETREKISLANQNPSDEIRRKISEKSKGNTNMLGKHHSDETKWKIAEKSKGNTNMLGKHHSDETKEKIKIKRKLQIFTPETREKLSKSLKGRIFSDETKQKMSDSAHKTKVYQYDMNMNFIAEFDSITEAKEVTKCANISYVCSGKRNHSNHFIWKYKNNVDEEL